MAFEIALICNPGGGTLPAALSARCKALCEAEGIPPEGITIMGGNPYINVTGLDNKIRRRAETEKLVFAGCTVDPVDCPAGDRREFKGVVTYFDAAHFTEALKSVSGLTPEAILQLREAYTYRYSDVGSCSLKTAKMSTMQNADNIAMLASRRASNRAKRAATGVGLTSIEEVAGEPLGKSDDVTIKPTRAAKTPPIIDAEFSTAAGGASVESGDANGVMPPPERPTPAPTPPAPVAAGSPKAAPSDVTHLQIHIKDVAKAKGFGAKDLQDRVKAHIGKASSLDFTLEDCTKADVFLAELPANRQAGEE